MGTKETTVETVQRLNDIVADCKSAKPTGGGVSKAAMRRAKREAFNNNRREIAACIARLQVNSASVRVGKNGSYGAVHFSDYVRK